MKDVSWKYLIGKRIRRYHSIPMLGQALVGTVLCFRFGRKMPVGASQCTEKHRVRAFDVVKEDKRVVVQEYLPFEHAQYAKFLKERRKVFWCHDWLIDVLPRGKSEDRRFGTYPEDMVLNWDRPSRPRLADVPMDPFLLEAGAC
jgi:hypothetical protein